MMYNLFELNFKLFCLCTVNTRVFCLQLLVEVARQDQRELFCLQISPETTQLDRHVFTLYLCPESLVSSVCTHVHKSFQTPPIAVNTVSLRISLRHE